MDNELKKFAEYIKKKDFEVHFDCEETPLFVYLIELADFNKNVIEIFGNIFDCETFYNIVLREDYVVINLSLFLQFCNYIEDEDKNNFIHYLKMEE